MKIKKLLTYSQYVLPTHFLSYLMGKLADAPHPALKNWMIKNFIKRYRVNLNEAIIKNPLDYPTFNSFFIRQLAPTFRPIAEAENSIVSPVDGTIAQIGKIHQGQLLQAKEMYFSLSTLLNDTSLASLFHEGAYATFYLAPHNYHRVHMPLRGQLEKTIYLPGKLFSVNRMTSDLIPALYSRNERLITLFNTSAGKMAIILVGAMIVGSIQTVWMQQPIREKQPAVQHFSNHVILNKGQELGFFKLGSTVILLFEKDKIRSDETFKTHSPIIFGKD